MREQERSFPWDAGRSKGWSRVWWDYSVQWMREQTLELKKIVVSVVRDWLGALLSESKGKGVRWKKYTYTYVYIYKVCSHGGQSGFLKMNMGSCYFFLLSETLSGFPSTQDPSSESFPCLYTLHGLSTQLPFSCSLISRNILSTTMLQGLSTYYSVCCCFSPDNHPFISIRLKIPKTLSPTTLLN